MCIAAILLILTCTLLALSIPCVQLHTAYCGVSLCFTQLRSNQILLHISLWVSILWKIICSENLPSCLLLATHWYQLPLSLSTPEYLHCYNVFASYCKPPTPTYSVTSTYIYFKGLSIQYMLIINCAAFSETRMKIVKRLLDVRWQLHAW